MHFCHEKSVVVPKKSVRWLAAVGGMGLSTYMGVGQNPVSPMTLKSLLKGGNLPKRYPLGFDP